MISALNRLVDLVEEQLAAEFDVSRLAGEFGTTDYHLRRMFSSLTGMPLSEYVRRRRMTVAAADVVRGEDDLLSIAVRYGYGSTEAFGRAFRAVHGAGPRDVRRDGGPLRTQPRLRIRLTVEGSIPMDTRLIDRPRSGWSDTQPASRSFTRASTRTSSSTSRPCHKRSISG